MSAHPPVFPVVLCGGSGTRLWPLSRKALPKQFVPLIPRDGKELSLLQMTLERVKGMAPKVLTVASEEHRFLAQAAATAAGVEVQHILEPAGRNTAAAMAVAALFMSPEALLLFTPADHFIPDAQAFQDTVRQGVPAALQGQIVTFGVTPTFPSTAFGYIARGEHLEGAAHKVARFVEKPTADVAQTFLLSGDYFWNAGVFLVQARTLLEALEQHAPDILAACRQAIDRPEIDRHFVRLHAEPFVACRSESIDYAVLEHHDKVALVPFTGQWSDVGSWNAVAALVPADSSGNRIHGAGFAVDSSNTYIHATQRPVVALGTKDLLIIDTTDALLVADASHTEQVKKVVAELEARGVPQATQHRHVARPWGSYDSIDQGSRFQVKRITVEPGAALSLQMHHHRAEHWIVVSGTAKVTKGKETFLLTENQSTFIPLGEVHRLENPGKSLLEMIEVQSGSYLGEDDIVRLEDTYGRIKTT
ncbi:MAG: mannose-1-phosphate guanylyltransferase/mannose-6-phosphate isomerase [Gammaproteobacteria bacterium]|nr:mannose-1-phosphate guanylyltransferase/mannose-6-phosphate isomerase [Gammaproteobacteria bacterium]MBU0788493.1 mannose-1-phosphate guanylyltransferase/mannose-6-phosphate isomerase [Gammaproteobacteria bacterium]MBU0815683.1 mannose-1-phosphate guanylyltransferase/mannose-6-phosphate isomerase [Gammaproteobacteria bacterium]MBU1788109.1 mannose-1-phosphate guanylyltransferase/mannose-6-phosphate isomerase [Gammaproteobacteria bacterium]